MRMFAPLLTAFAVAMAIFVAAVFYVLTVPVTIDAGDLPPTHTPDLANGRTMFDIGGCASCHAVPNHDADKVDRTRLGGGLALASPFGTFYVPNISSDPRDGIGAWSEADFVSALWDGTSPKGEHLYPAFPYTSYRHMRLDDVRDLFAYLKTLPPVKGRVRGHDLPFPFDIRRPLGLWQLLFLRGGPFTPDPSRPAAWNRGAYLVNGPGHCAECHSPRNISRRHHRERTLRRRSGRRRQGLGAQHHAGRIAALVEGRHRLERKGYRRLSRRRHESGRRFCRRRHGRSDPQYLVAVRRTIAPPSRPTSSRCRRGKGRSRSRRSEPAGFRDPFLIARSPLTPTLSPTGRGGAPCRRRLFYCSAAMIGNPSPRTEASKAIAAGTAISLSPWGRGLG